MKLPEQYECFSISECPSGIVCLIIGTKDKWVHYHQYNNGKYQIGGDPDYPSEDDMLRLDPEIETYLDKLYLLGESQEKDQIEFFYIPWETAINDVKNKKIVFSGPHNK